MTLEAEPVSPGEALSGKLSGKLYYTGISLDSDKDIAGYFNRYFSSVFTMEDNLNYSASTSVNADKADITCEDLYIDLGTIDLDQTKQWDLMSYQLNYLLKYRAKLLIPCYFSLKSHYKRIVYSAAAASRHPAAPPPPEKNSARHHASRNLLKPPPPQFLRRRRK